jgi:hypothetical protein
MAKAATIRVSTAMGKAIPSTAKAEMVMGTVAAMAWA